MTNVNDEKFTPARIEMLSDISKYTLSSSIEVQYVLRNLVKSHAPVAICFNRDAEFIVTTLLDVDDKNNVLVFDEGASSNTNKRLLAADSSVFTSNPDGIKIQFTGSKITSTTWDGEPAFSMPLPKSVIKLQRREFFRIQTPITNPLIFTIKHPEVGVIKLKVVDISLGGVALMLPEEHPFQLFEQYNSCRLDVPDFGEFVVSLQTRNIVSVPLKNGKTMLRMGCCFVDLPAKQGSMLQRLIAHIERERNVLAGE